MFYLKLLISITIFYYCYADRSCDIKWPRCGTVENIVCRNGGTCKPDLNSDCVPIPNNNTFRDWIVEVHNCYRNRIALGEVQGVASAANMRVINYDLDLEYTASCSANLCKPQTDYCGRTKKFWQNGQNMEIIHGGEDVISSIPHRWFDNIRFMKPEGYRHYWKNLSLPLTFTQMIWAETTHIGCARAYSSKESKIVLVCNYGPPGNINLLPIYKAGEPVSKCPPGMHGNSEYRGLCGTVQPVSTNRRITVKVRSGAVSVLKSNSIFALICTIISCIHISINII
ncbi:scoloptoxin SSD976-like [Diorhabda carinulata]|uniref:scoloptoxin SSD976-like n=1 Tax=Diorhabda carinulata TaxID=1163345 RepID=UPI0025A29F83|nr:scoloptoxin SSD976-like [Diorhabda carinulata]